MTPFPKDQSICVIGAGPSGLVTAHTLRRDGFTNVQVFTRDRAAGGGWAPQRIYPGLFINNVHGEYRFSALEMPEPLWGSGGRLSGEDMSLYMRDFAETFLSETIQYNVEVLRVQRDGDTNAWRVTLLNLLTRKGSVKSFDKIVLCTGGASEPHIPPGLSPSTARFGGPILHSNDFGSRVQEILDAPGPVVVIGGGKSAQDISAYIARQGKQVCVVFDKADAFLAVPVPLPAFIRKSRFMGIMSPYMDLNSRLERFLHCTRIGNRIVHAVWNFITWSSFKAFGVPAESPLRRAHSMFWGLRFNDEGVGHEWDFFSLVKRSEIELVAPARASGYREGVVVLEAGREVKAGSVVLCTGYTSSWGRLMDQETRELIGLERAPPFTAEVEDEWKHYTSLKDPPRILSPKEQLSSAIYRGLVPAKSILKKNFAINGAVFTTNNGYVFETSANWISSYFLEDPFLSLPSSVEETYKETDRTAAWMRKRYPGISFWINESYSAGMAAWSWPQYCDRLFADMGLKTMRSGGNWFTWPFKAIDLKELEGVWGERKLKSLGIELPPGEIIVY